MRVRRAPVSQCRSVWNMESVVIESSLILSGNVSRIYDARWSRYIQVDKQNTTKQTNTKGINFPRWMIFFLNCVQSADSRCLRDWERIWPRNAGDKFSFDKLISKASYYCHNHNAFRSSTANIDHAAADIDGKVNKHIGDNCMQIS